MKRNLPLIDGADDARPSDPVTVRIGERVIFVRDAGDGTSASRFADLLVEAGGTIVEPPDSPAAVTRIVVRTPLQSPRTRLHSDALEAGADLVLGSVRDELAKRLASTCTRGASG